MSLGPGHSRGESAPAIASGPDEALGSLKACLVEGDSEQLARERRVRRNALAISVLIQVAVLAALVLLPLFGTAEKITLDVVTPIQGYSGSGDPLERHSPPRGGRQLATPISKYTLCAPTKIPPTIADADNATPPQIEGTCPNCSSDSSGPQIPGADGLFNPDSNRPQPPVEAKPSVQTRGRVKITTIEPAMLLRKVEPVYPIIAVHTRREGRVELRAVISTDGTIQSLEVVSGHPLFLQSALDAVRQWRYRPTILNGAPVEVETRITVIYNLQR